MVNLLQDLQQRLGLTYLFIAHDLAVVRHISDRVAVMYLGRIVEIGDRRRTLRRSKASLHRALLSAVPCRIPASSAAAAASSCRAMCPARSTRRPAAGSIRAARSSSIVAEAKIRH